MKDSQLEEVKSHMIKRNAIASGVTNSIIIVGSIILVIAVVGVVASNSESFMNSADPNFKIIDVKLTGNYRNISDNSYFVMNFINFEDREIDVLTWQIYDDTGKQFSANHTNIIGKEQRGLFAESANTIFTDGKAYSINIFFTFSDGNEFHNKIMVTAGV